MKHENKLVIKVMDSHLELLKTPDEGSANLLMKLEKFWNDNVSHITK